MPTTTTTRPQMAPITAPTGFWKVLTVIAERIPQHQLIWLAVLLSLVVLSFGYLTYACITKATESKPAAALTGYLKQHTKPKTSNAPQYLKTFPVPGIGFQA